MDVLFTGKSFEVIKITLLDNRFGLWYYYAAFGRSALSLWRFKQSL